MTTLQQITNGGLSSSEIGTKLEYLLGIYFASTQVTLRLPNNLSFHISTASTDLRGQLGFADWVDSPCIVCYLLQPRSTTNFFSAGNAK